MTSWIRGLLIPQFYTCRSLIDLLQYGTDMYINYICVTYLSIFYYYNTPTDPVHHHGTDPHTHEHECERNQQSAAKSGTQHYIESYMRSWSLLEILPRTISEKTTPQRGSDNWQAFTYDHISNWNIKHAFKNIFIIDKIYMFFVKNPPRLEQFLLPQTSL